MAHLAEKCYRYDGYARMKRYSAIHSAIHNYNGNIDTIKDLLEKDDISINARNSEGKTPLHVALKHERCSVELINLLLKYRADVKATSTLDGNGALHWLASSYSTDFMEQISIAKILLKRGCDVNARNLKGSSPLHLAATRRSYLPLISLFLEYKSDPDMRNFKGDTPLHLYLQNEEAKLSYIRDFLKKVRYINLPNAKGETPLHLAVRNKCTSGIWVIKLLLVRGADARIIDAVGHNAYVAYCRAMEDRHRRPDPMLKMLLLENGLQQYMLNSSLYIACLFHKYDSVRKLLRLGADVNARNSSGYSPLYYALNACEDGDDCSTLRLVLDYGADLNYEIAFPDGSHKSLLEMAIIPGDIENYMAVADIVLHHLAKLFTLQKVQAERGLDVEVLSPHNKVFFRSIENLEDVKGYKNRLCRYEEEVKLMRNTEIGESGVSFLDLLLADSKKTALYAKNKAMIKAFRAMQGKFPMYRGMLVAKLARDVERRKLVQKAAVLLSNTLRFAEPGDEFFERTFSYCSNKDLINLINELNK